MHGLIQIFTREGNVISKSIYYYNLKEQKREQEYGEKIECDHFARRMQNARFADKQNKTEDGEKYSEQAIRSRRFAI